MSYYQEFSSVSDSNGNEVFFDSGSGDFWLEVNGKLVEQGSLDTTTNSLVLELTRDMI